MHQSQNLSLQQVLAPQLQQSLLILQAPLLELRNLVQQEMETNPVLEELATDPDSPSTTESAASDQEFKEEFDKLAKLDEEWRDYMAQSAAIAPCPRGRRETPVLFRFHCHHPSTYELGTLLRTHSHSCELIE